MQRRRNLRTCYPAPSRSTASERYAPRTPGRPECAARRDRCPAGRARINLDCSKTCGNATKTRRKYECGTQIWLWHGTLLWLCFVERMWFSLRCVALPISFWGLQGDLGGNTCDMVQVRMPTSTTGPEPGTLRGTPTRGNLEPEQSILSVMPFSLSTAPQPYRHCLYSCAGTSCTAIYAYALCLVLSFLWFYSRRDIVLVSTNNKFEITRKSWG